VLESIPFLSKSDSTPSVTDWQYFIFRFLKAKIFCGVAKIGVPEPAAKLLAAGLRA